MKPPKKLLILDDEEIFGKNLSDLLSDSFEVKFTTSPKQAYNIAISEQLDAILLDINLGTENGLDFCENLRSNALTKNVQIFLMTGYGGKNIHMQSYKVGADDYIEKPFDTDELKLRLLSRLKRIESIIGIKESVGNIKIFVERSEIEIDGQVTYLSLVEMQLLKVFMANVNKKITREEILKAVWPDTKVEDRTVDVHVSGLRKKLKNFDHNIQSLYGSGYILKPGLSKTSH